MYNILLGGAAGDGIETMAMLLEKILKQSGFYVFTIRDVMSRVRGGHNFVLMSFGTEPIYCHRDELHVIFAMNEESIELHLSELKADGVILADESLLNPDKRTISLELKKTAKEAGNAKTVTSAAIGAILSLFGLSLNHVKEILEASLKPELAKVNLTAVNDGYLLLKPRFTTLPSQEEDLTQESITGKSITGKSPGGKPLNPDDYIQLSGTTAATLGAIAAGLKFYSAYPMSPSTGILEYLLQYGEKLGIIVEQAEDEIAAANMAVGAAYAGAPAMTGTSGGGFCLMTEALGFAGIAELPVVFMDVQRPGPATGLPTRTEQSDLKFVISAAQGEFPRMVIALRSHEDAFYQTARAFGLAKKYQIPIILLSDQYLADATAVTPIFDTKKIYKDIPGTPHFETPYKSYEYTENGISTRLIPGKTEHLVRADSDEHDEYGLITESAEVRNRMMDKRMKKLKSLERELLEPEFIGNEQCEILLVCFGSTTGAVKEAVSILNREEGRYGALAFGDIYPLPTSKLKRCAAKAYKVISVEQNATGQLTSLLRDEALIECDQTILKYDGRQMTSSYILEAIKNPRRR